ncbi:adenylyltransferase/cytidyltransferase family protein [Deinococcus alpinitundrae]|uniref:adenylyltransferase/cytidyltransferase family protein n=1 Tax=Deinococcus alpinitundrae TaxID=468913 RepID=UPI00137A1DB5|nr:adenylyltransferase/cytidyltransferase family protein [Deinococcus alpinitundrae]
MGTAVYIGRFQPPHDGHLASMQSALERHTSLHVLLGSANLARSSKNPWTPAERQRLIVAALQQQGTAPSRVRFSFLPDEFDAERWAARVRRAVGQEEPVLVGFEKDASSHYLQWFPEWPREPSPITGQLNATQLRAAYFAGQPVTDVPEPVSRFLQRWRRTPVFARLRAEQQAILVERAAWDGQTRRELLVLDLQEDQLRLQRRRAVIGRGLLALPGRLLAAGEAAPPGARIFDHPARALSLPTTAYVVRGEASGGEWVSLAALSRSRQFFEDHQVIVRRLLES